MPYILYKTNGNKLLTVNDASVDTTTSLSFVGRNYAGYGDIVNENFVKLLENFTNSIPPTTPIQGQLWFDSTTDNERLNVCYDGKNFKGIANIHIQSATPASSKRGDLWWDVTNEQLKTYDGSVYILVGPQNPYGTKSGWDPAAEKSQEDINTDIYFIKGRIGYKTVATLSDSNFTPLETSELWTNFKKIKTGITLEGSDPITGVSSSGSAGALFWGTAADALVATTATTVSLTSTSSGVYYLPLVGSTNTLYRKGLPLYASSGLSYDAATDVLNATAISAKYADLAERYEADTVYEPGTVLVLGGDKEVTVTTLHADTRVAGIVTTNPAYLMNSEAGNDESHPGIALKGRVPCKVYGVVNKGDLLVTSEHPGYACSASASTVGFTSDAVIGKALGTNSEGFGVIEVKV